MDQKKLSEIVNQSGFPLQIGIAQHIKFTNGDHGWKVLHTEHSWESVENDDNGFIDLVLEDQHGTSVILVECKRVLESSWVFLNASPNPTNRRHAKTWVTCYIAENAGSYGWVDLTLEPSCPESQYCVIFGQDAKSKPMIERIGADLVSATEALAQEEKPYLARQKDAIRMYFSVILTTAQLKICSFDPKDISLVDGKINKSSFLDVPFVRFRKQLSTRLPKPNFSEGLGRLAYAKEHTIFVVNAEAISRFLSSFELDDDVFRRLSR